MNKFEEHPTWQMLEKTKIELKVLLNDIAHSMEDIPLYMQEEVKMSVLKIRSEHNKIVQLQLKLESKLLANE